MRSVKLLVTVLNNPGTTVGLSQFTAVTLPLISYMLLGCPAPPCADICCNIPHPPVCSLFNASIKNALTLIQIRQ